MRLGVLIKGSLAAAAAGGLVLAVPATASDKKDRERAAAAIAGVAIAGAIIAANKDRDRERRYDRYERDGRHYYRRDWGQTFRPSGSNHVVCFRRTRQCYKKGQYSRKWTVREFGYYGR